MSTCHWTMDWIVLLKPVHSRRAFLNRRFVSSLEPEKKPFPVAPAWALWVMLTVLYGVPLSWGDSFHLHLHWRKPIEVARGAAVRGPWRMNDSDWRFVDDPGVAITDQGDVGVVWADHSRQDIFFQAYDPSGKARFSRAVNISRSPGIFSWLPRVIMTSDHPGQVYVLWQEIIFSGGTHGGEILFARSVDGGETFGEPLNLSNTPAGAGKGRLTRESWFNGSMDLVRSADGILHAVWTEYEGALRFSRSTDGGGSFSEPVLIAGGRDESPARGPSLAVGPGNDVHLVWAVGEEPDADLHYTVSMDQGLSFESPQRIVKSPSYSDAPKIAVDIRGTIHIVYAQSPTGPLQHYQIHYTRKMPGDSTFQKPVGISGAQTDRFKSMGFPYLALDAEDQLYVLWELFPDAKSFPRGLGFTFSGNRGESFGPATVVPGLDPELGFNGSQQGLFMKKLAVNSSGEMAIVNSTFNPHHSSHIWLIRGRSDRGRSGGQETLPREKP